MKTCVVTGAASGIGRSLSVRLIEEGWRVWALDINGAELDLIASEQNSKYSTPRLMPFVLNIAKEDGWILFSNKLKAIDEDVCVLVNSAGLMSPKDSDLLNTPIDVFDKILKSNLYGTFLWLFQLSCWSDP